MKHGFLEILLLAQHKTDPKLALHAKRVACYASELAIFLGHEDKSKKLFIAGLLHDLGFLSLNINHSENNFNLTKESSIKELQRHPLESERLSSTLSSDQELLKAIRHHHEKYNGEGYPDQLEGENIPICARILTVVDSFDSLLVGKLYGEKRITPADAIAQMSNENNTDLDPTIVEAFIKLLEKNPVLSQPQEHNSLAVYKMVFLKEGILEQGNLINQDGTVLIKQGSELTEKILERIRLEFPGQKMIIPVEDDELEEKQETEE